jgi:hypothetical protein
MNTAILLNSSQFQPSAQRKKTAYTNEVALSFLAHFKFFEFKNREKEQDIDSIQFAQKAILVLTQQIGLSMSNTAKVLQVSRPTAYSWLNATRGPQTAQMNRIRKLNHVISFLKKEKATTFDLDFTAILPDGSSILSILADDFICESKLESALNCLRNHNTAYILEISEEELESGDEIPEGLIKLFQSGKKPG